MNIGYYFDLAKKVALKPTAIRKSYQLGAVALRSDGVLVAAQNGSDKVPNQKAHAESRVLRKSGFHAIVFVVRVGRDKSTLKLAKPCPKCQSEMKNKRVKCVYYSINDNEYGVITFG